MSDAELTASLQRLLGGLGIPLNPATLSAADLAEAIATVERMRMEDEARLRALRAEFRRLVRNERWDDRG